MTTFLKEFLNRIYLMKIKIRANFKFDVFYKLNNITKSCNNSFDVV